MLTNTHQTGPPTAACAPKGDLREKLIHSDLLIAGAGAHLLGRGRSTS